MGLPVAKNIVDTAMRPKRSSSFLRYFFDELRYQKATVTVYSFNVASIRLHEKLGFQREGQIRRTVYTRGQYFDELFYGMTCEEFAERYGE